MTRWKDGKAQTKRMHLVVVAARKHQTSQLLWLLNDTYIPPCWAGSASDAKGDEKMLFSKKYMGSFQVRT